MGKGYAEGPAAEERFAELERAEREERDEVPERPAVFGATADNPETHFLGWLGEVDPDDLFASGAAWGISVRRRAVGIPHSRENPRSSAPDWGIAAP